jgi:hypothetical protein
LEIEAGPGVNAMRYPIDLVTDKHELISYDLDEADSWQHVEVEHNGRTYRVRVPRAYDKGVKRIIRTDDCGELLYLIGEVGLDYDDSPIGCFIVARPLEDGTYRTVIFHSLYPWTLRGLA